MSKLRFPCSLSFGIECFLMLAASSAPADAQIVVKNEDVTFKFGVQGQLWADWTQDPSGTQGYQQNFFLRRARIIVAGDIGKDLSFFFETDDPKLGITPKNLAAGFIIQDALIEWRPAKQLQLSGGLFIVPFTRNGLQSTLSYLTLDLSPHSGGEQLARRNRRRCATWAFSSRDSSPRIACSTGSAPSTASAMPTGTIRCVRRGYLQYDFFDREKGYLFSGTGLGKAKILAVDAGFDRQGSYRGYSANVAAAIPVRKGDEVAGQFQYIRYDGRAKFPGIPLQNDFLVEAGYYCHKVKIQPFVKYEAQAFAAAANASQGHQPLRPGRQLLHSRPEPEVDRPISARPAAERFAAKTGQRVHGAASVHVFLIEGHSIGESKARTAGDAAMATSRQMKVESQAVPGPGISRWWRVVGGLSMNLALGTLYGWSVFVAPLEKQFGWTRAQTSMVFTIAVVVFALSFVVAGRIQDKFGPFYCSLTGGLLVSLGFFLCSYTTSLTYLFVCFGVIGGLGNGFGYATPIPVMAKWFPDKRGLAVGLAVGGYGAGSAIFGPLSQLKLIPAYGLPATFQILGVDLSGDDADRRLSAEEPAGRL